MKFHLKFFQGQGRWAGDGLGFVVSSLEEASRVVQECTVEEYDQMVTRAKYTAYLIKNGYFTKKLFIDSMMLLD